MVSFNAALVSLASASLAFAHIQMSWPYPYRSKFNPATLEADKDYSMTAPLGTYPCKGYIDTSASPVATWSAGQTYNYTLAGTAVHGGGSCQLALSYDGGSSWNVILSYMGGCVLDSLTENFDIPNDAPSGKAVFAWIWFNLIGNREMYMNCASVEITGGGSGLDSSDYPAPFIANVEPAGTCKTVEGTNVVFPDPGKNVRYGGVYAASQPTTPAGYTGDCGATGSSTLIANNAGSASSTAGGAYSAASSAATTAASAASAAATTKKACKRKRSRSRSRNGIAKRDPRLRPRATSH